MFSKILIANRGEIACRVAATASRMGIGSVAVYSTADARAKHVAVCDEAVLIGPPAAKESYLRSDKIIAAALATGAQAIHPGYGFLSENEEFANACAQAGLTFIGPPASAIRAMGSKSAAKTLMEKAGVPLVPGYHGDNQEAGFLRDRADDIGYPVLLKASAGGGGKGMRIVERSEDFVTALASCKREAISSFGDDKVLVEKYLTRPRHIEIQVFADSHGHGVYLFERDCSVQRRHQKVLEEAPAPGMTEERRAAMGEAAVAAAKAVAYVGAGTVEFIVNTDGSFYFMEMNTRLQVEHPVTEMITGIDLVEWQLRVAAGEALPKRQDQLTIHGHALEARIYAENPDKEFLPSIGTLRYLGTPEAVTFCTGVQGKSPARVRIDSGVRQGDTISSFYDPMIAKLIVWGEDRAAALAAMSNALSQYRVVGLATNIAFLKRLTESAAFSQADLDTGLIERNREALFPPPAPATPAVLGFAVAAVLGVATGAGADPWTRAAGWRMNAISSRTLSFSDETRSYHIILDYAREGWRLQLGDRSVPYGVNQVAGEYFTMTLDGTTLKGVALRHGEAVHVFHGGAHSILYYADPLDHGGQVEAEAGRLTAPMPGRIVAIPAGLNMPVEKGAPLLIMEAMKMEHTITAPTSGVVTELLYGVGDQVADGDQLLVLSPNAA